MFSKISRVFTIAASVSVMATLAACDGNYGSANYPPPSDNDSADSASVSVISNAINHGIADDGTGTNTNQVYLELDGTFSTANDNVVGVTCSGQANSQVTLVSQANDGSQIILMIPVPSSDTTCNFSVMSPELSEGDFGPIAVSATQTPLVITSGLDNGGGNITLSGTFVGGTDTVLVSCNGNTLNASTINIASDTASQINVTITDPASTANCTFDVVGNTVQTPDFALSVNP